MTLGENLQQLRKNAGLSQEEVAQKLFLTRQSISKWENGGAEPGVENLKALANLYGVTVDELIGNVPEEKLQPESQASNGSYYAMVAVRVALVLAIGLFSMEVEGSLSIPFDLIAMIVGIWVTAPAVRIIILCLLACNIVFGVVAVIISGTVVGAINAAISVLFLWLMNWPEIKARFQP